MTTTTTITTATTEGSTEPKADHTAFNFYEYQKKRTIILLGWGLGNVAIGSLFTAIIGLRNPRGKAKTWLHFWLQAIAWGAIDALIAAYGLAQQTKKLQQLALDAQTEETGEANPKAEAKVAVDIKHYYKVVHINAYVDLTYILSGGIIARWGLGGPDVKRGIALGFVWQGFVLFCYDLLLSNDIKKRWLNK